MIKDSKTESISKLPRGHEYGCFFDNGLCKIRVEVYGDERTLPFLVLRHESYIPTRPVQILVHERKLIVGIMPTQEGEEEFIIRRGSGRFSSSLITNLPPSIKAKVIKCNGYTLRSTPDKE